ncbi:sterol desaturase family protein [Hahella ganghwensis]|uniref:sterol desaturase family protein n=1 Tax=Hahella ganghwensis TaxID=286420 RepID=UPI000360F9AC|nr:sterol desaturase family protein [Hahella ganghwensis]
MSEFLISNEPLIRGGAFLGIFSVMAIWEGIRPIRARQYSRTRRWFSNLGILVLNSLLLRLLFPLAAVGTAMHVEELQWGVLNWIPIPEWLVIILAFLVLDFAIYLQHRLFHRVPVLWRLHRMHHADPEIDVSTGVRFHPLEILLSMLIKIAVVIVLGAPALAVLLFEIVLNATSLFNHTNISLPAAVEKILRWVIVTPDYHRVHHSRIPEETDSNFGFNLPWWDRWLGTYRAQPLLGHLGMRIGLAEFSDQPEEMKLGQMLTQPFR